MAAINDIRNTKSGAHLETLEQIQDNLSPGNKRRIKVSSSQCPRVERNTEQQNLTRSQAPRVWFAENLTESQPPPRIIVALPTIPIVASSDKAKSQQEEKPKSILRKPSIVESESITECFKGRTAKPIIEPEESFVKQVAACRRQKEQANPVLDDKTGEMFECRQLLHHLNFKETWNQAGVNKFGWLAQGVGGRVKGTNTIEFIHKHDIPQE